VVVSGDITQRARAPEFQRAADFMAALPACPKLVIPGNHDIPLFNVFARAFAPYANYERAFGPRESARCNEEVCIAGFDATSPMRHTRGALASSAIDARMAEVAPMRTSDDALLIACVHQPLHTAWAEDRHEVLIDAEQVAQVFSKYKVDLVLSGHVHVPLVATTRDAFPALAQHFVLAGAGTAVSHRTRPGAPNSFNSIKLERRDGSRVIVVTQHRFESEKRSFVAQPPERFGRDAEGWSAL
jgi:3',5'-cyclic AMP phosphodiesterase CpdA